MTKKIGNKKTDNTEKKRKNVNFASHELSVYNSCFK